MTSTLTLALLLTSFAVHAQPAGIQSSFGSGSTVLGNADHRLILDTGFFEIPGSNGTLQILIGADLHLPDVPLASIADAKGVAGHEVTVGLSLDDAADVVGGDFIISYDPDVLTPVAVTPTGLSENAGLNLVQNLDLPGETRVGFVRENLVTSGGGALFGITFVVSLEAEPADYPVILEQAVLTTLPADILAAVSHGTVTVRSITLGDIDNDGEVTASDVLLALRIAIEIILPTPAQEVAADVNQDGVISIKDAVLILHHTLGVITAFTKPAVLAEFPADVPVDLSELTALPGEGVAFDLTLDVTEAAVAGDLRLAWKAPAGTTVLASVIGLTEEVLTLQNAETPDEIRVNFIERETISTPVSIRLEVTNPAATPIEIDLSGTLLDARATEIGRITFSQTIDTDIPTEFALSQNHPNPFNPATTIRYDVPGSGHVRITIYDITGQEVRRLVDRRESPGRHSVLWNGRDSRGRTVSSGIYFYRMAVDGGRFTDVKRMVFLK